MKNILFVCVENACRSQMAEGIASSLGKGILKAYSAGSQPSGKVNQEAIKVMGEIGIDISSANPKSFDSLPIKKFDYVVTLGCRDICPFVPAEKHLEWEIDDPKGESIEFFREIRNQIKGKIEELIKDISGQEKKEGGV